MRKLLITLLATMTIVACVPTKKLKYTIDTPGSSNSYQLERDKKIIQPHDYLYIRLYSLDPTTNEIFNGRSGQNNQINVQLESYEVDKEGFVTFPFVGRINVSGSTIDEAQVILEKELSKYLTNISLRVRFVANSVTVLGEVGIPGNKGFYDEKINIFEVIGAANGIGTYGDKTKVTVMREVDGHVTYSYLDLTDKRIVESPDYYLQPNDIVIVSPLDRKYRDLQDRNLINTIASAVSLIISVATLSSIL